MAQAVADTPDSVSEVSHEDYLAVQQQLDDAQALLNTVDHSFAVIEFEPDGRIITANDNFLKALGYTPNEIQGQHHRLFVDSLYANSPEYRDFWAPLGSW